MTNSGRSPVADVAEYSPPDQSNSPRSTLNPEQPPPPPQQADPNAPPQFSAPPSDGGPRVWFLSAADSPIAVSLALHLVKHGDCVVAAVAARTEDAREGRHELEELAAQTSGQERGRCVVVQLDMGSVASVQAALARAVTAFHRIDVLFACTGEALVGTVEELAQTPRAQSLVRDQFGTNFFGPVNVVKGVLPYMRAQRNGHVVLLTGITGHLGTPGLGVYCASQWAIEGYCDSLAYEIAPFNIRVSIVQSNIEVSMLTNRVTSVPSMPEYGGGRFTNPLARPRHEPEHATSETHASLGSQDATEPSQISPEGLAQRQRTRNAAPLARGWLGSLLGRLETAAGREGHSSGLARGDSIASLYPALPDGFQDALIAETVYALLAIGGHENPPARHIVGHEGVATVKEKLRTVSEELEDFVAVSGSVDL